MRVLLDLESLALLLEHDTYIHIQSRSIGRKGGIVCILHIAPCPLCISI